MKTAVVINEGSEQSIRLPLDLHIDAAEVFVKRVGRALIIIPKDCDPWQMFMHSLHDFTDDYMAERAEPEQQIRGQLFE